MLAIIILAAAAWMLAGRPQLAGVGSGAASNPAVAQAFHTPLTQSTPAPALEGSGQKIRVVRQGLDYRLASERAHHEADHQQHEEDHEKDLGDAGGYACQGHEAQEARDDRQNEKRQGPTESMTRSSKTAPRNLLWRGGSNVPSWAPFP